MADTSTSTSQRTSPGEHVDDLYDQAVETPFKEPDADRAAEAKAAAVHGVIRPSAGGQKAEISHVGEMSMLRIEQLRAESVESKTEIQRLRQEVLRLRNRNAAVESINTQLDERLSQADASDKKALELQRSVEYLRAARRSMRKEVQRAQESLIESEKRFNHTETQLRAIAQERADRIAGLVEEVKVLQRGKAELEHQVETLLGYRQRAMSCMQQLTDELKRLRGEYRVKSRRLSEAYAVLQGIDQRLAESTAESA